MDRLAELINKLLLNHVRAIVYKLGFRPKIGTVLYSPSHDYSLAARAAMRKCW